MPPVLPSMMTKRRVPYAVLVAIKTNPTKLDAKAVVLVNIKINLDKIIANPIVQPVLLSMVIKLPVPNAAPANTKIKQIKQVVNPTAMPVLPLTF